MKKEYLEYRDGLLFIHPELKDRLIQGHKALVRIYKGEVVNPACCPLCRMIDYQCDYCSYTTLTRNQNEAIGDQNCRDYWLIDRNFKYSDCSDVAQMTDNQIQEKILFHKEMIDKLENAFLIPISEKNEWLPEKQIVILISKD